MNVHRLNRVLLQTLLLPVVALGLVSGLLVWQILRAERTVIRIQLVDRNIASATLASALVADEESGIRGFQNTGNPIFLQPYQLAAGPLQKTFDSLRSSLTEVGADPVQIDELAAAHTRWLNDVALPMIALVKSGANTSDAGLNLRGKASMDQVRAVLTRINNDQKTERHKLISHWEQQTRHTLEAVVGLALIIGLMIGVFARERLHLVSQAFQDTLVALRRHAQTTHESAQRLRTILSSIGDGVIVCDTAGCIELLNPVAQDLTGWTQEMAFHQPLDSVLKLIDVATGEPIQTNVSAPARQTSALGSDNAVTLIRRDEKELQIDESGSSLYDRSGKLTGAVIVFRDVTGQRRTQAALLASEKLAVAGRLAATIAHEIHNPLDSVVNLLYLLRTGVTPEENERFLDMASAELDRVTQISRAMLGMYRESKVPVALDLAAVFQSLFLLLEPQLTHARVVIRPTLEPNSIVSGFPAELRQVFTNLLTNAADASPASGSIEVDVRRTPAAPADGSGIPPRPAGVCVSITDHGVGIGPETLAQLFQPFFTTKGEQGTGLGLWVSQGIVQKHNGVIDLVSRRDAASHGTTVNVFLPRGEAELKRA